MLSNIIRHNDLSSLKQKVKKGYKIDNNRYVYDAIATFDCEMIKFVLLNTIDKHSTGEVYFFMIDSSDEYSIDDKVECFKMLLQFYKRPLQQFETLKELDKRIEEENERRLDFLESIIDKKGKSYCFNIDVREMIKEFL